MIRANRLSSDLTASERPVSVGTNATNKPAGT